MRHLAMTAVAVSLFVAGPAVSQTPPAPATPASRPAAETWWINKEPGGVYPGPGRPIWRLADLKKAHAGESNWRQLVVSDAHQQATYNSAKPGTAASARMRPVSQTMFVVIAGKVRFNIENQPDVVASRGSVVNILESTIFSYEVLDGENALWIEVTPANITDLYPLTAPPTPAAAASTKVAFARRPGEYRAPNQAHWNLFEAAAACQAGGARVRDEHLFASAIFGYLDPADPANKCAAPGAATAARPAAAPAPTGEVFGHLHTDMAEWWIIQSGGVRARFGANPELHAVEGDIIYAPRMTWHQLGYEGAGLSERLAITAFPFINMNSVAN